MSQTAPSPHCHAPWEATLTGTARTPSPSSGGLSSPESRISAADRSLGAGPFFVHRYGDGLDRSPGWLSGASWWGQSRGSVGAGFFGTDSFRHEPDQGEAPRRRNVAWQLTSNQPRPLSSAWVATGWTRMSRPAHPDPSWRESLGHAPAAAGELCGAVCWRRPAPVPVHRPCRRGL